MSTHRRLFVALSLVLAALTASVGAKEVQRFDSFFVFSDSLGDTGNDFILTSSLGIVPAVPPSITPHRVYFNGRFSNGPILFEYFWAAAQPKGGPVVPSLARTSIPKSGATSFAYGGSTSGATCFPLAGLKCQVEKFAQLLNGQAPPKRALYAVFSGANDVLQAANPFDPSVVAGIVTNVADSVRRLYQLGARDVMVLNMPNIGRAPMVIDPALKAALNGLAQQHNALLAAALAEVDALPGLRIIPIDVYGFFESLVTSSTFNFEVTALPPPLNFCLFEGNPAGINCFDVPTFNVDPTYFFWDIQHPTTSGHAATGAHLLSQVEAFYQD